MESIVCTGMILSRRRFKKMVARKRTPAHPSEHSEQVGLINWFRGRFNGVLIFAIPNGDKRALSVAKRLKAEGVTRGVPDLYVPAWNLWIEMKRKSGGRLSPEQKQIITYLQSLGHTVIV